MTCRSLTTGLPGQHNGLFWNNKYIRDGYYSRSVIFLLYLTQLFRATSYMLAHK